MDNVDKTIDVICTWIQKELESDSCTESDVLVRMVSALADLVASRYQPEQCN